MKQKRLWTVFCGMVVWTAGMTPLALADDNLDRIQRTMRSVESANRTANLPSSAAPRQPYTPPRNYSAPVVPPIPATRQVYEPPVIPREPYVAPRGAAGSGGGGSLKSGVDSKAAAKVQEVEETQEPKASDKPAPAEKKRGVWGWFGKKK